MNLLNIKVLSYFWTVLSCTMSINEFQYINKQMYGGIGPEFWIFVTAALSKFRKHWLRQQIPKLWCAVSYQNKIGT